MLFRSNAFVTGGVSRNGEQVRMMLRVLDGNAVIAFVLGSRAGSAVNSGVLK